MNILFVNYGGFTSNSINHIGPFAGRLTELGHSCIVAVPESTRGLESLAAVSFMPATYEEALEGIVRFPDGRGADVIHAWTPRENVRAFVLEYLSKQRARLVVHLEDNEAFLSSAYLGTASCDRADPSALQKADLAPGSLSHPLLHRFFLLMADAVTVIVPKLREMVPPGIRVVELAPGIDRSLYSPRKPDPSLRESLGLRTDERVIVFTGSNTFANEAELRDLYLAVLLLNQSGIPTRLVRTGHFSSEFKDSLPPDVFSQVLDLGYIEKRRLPDLAALSDVVVQPGRPGPFNDYRLPSKIPEMLAMGLPLVLPAANVGLELHDGEEALLLREGTPEEIAAACERVFSDPALAERLGKAALVFSARRYDLEANTAGLLALYQEQLDASPRQGSASAIEKGGSDVGLWLRTTAQSLQDASIREKLGELASYFDHIEGNRKALVELARLRDELERTKEAMIQARAHAENIRVSAETRDELTAQHVRNLEDLVAHFKETSAKLQADQGKLLAQADEQQKHNGMLVEKIEVLDRRLSGLAAESSALEQRLVQREDKIARMQASFSWQITSPLRCVRRLLEDIGKRKSSDRGTKVI